ncbi:MAG: hypothetical protein U0228_00505 [Myxococcaceae bacterium]
MREIELLERYAAHELLTELRIWEAMRSRLRAPAYVAPEQPAKTLVLLDGIPGAGKSTALSWLKPAVGAEWRSMARFAAAAQVSRDERMQHELATGTPHVVDEKFLAALDECPAPWVLLEKFPRSVVEAVALLEHVAQRGWRFEVLHLFLPGDCVATSVQRQLDRGPRHDVMPTPESARHRALAHLARAPSCRESLRSAGVPIHAIDTSQPREQVAATIRRALGLDFASLDFHRGPLEVLERVSNSLGIEAWVAGGHVYRAFWNGRFGPPQRPTDVDVAVERDDDAAPLLRALEAADPSERWSVLSPVTLLRQRWGLETKSVHEAKALATWVHRTGLVRWKDGAPELSLPEGTEAALRSGVVALNGRFLERLTTEQRAEVLRRDGHRAPSALKRYPGLRPGPGVEVAHVCAVVKPSWALMKREVRRVLATEPPPKVSHARRGLDRAELALAREIVAFHQTADLTPTSPLPAGERVRVRGVTAGTFADLAADADDATLARWVHAQLWRHHEVARDEWLQSVFDFSLFGPRLSRGVREQSAMHQGWPLELHLAQAVMQLDTSVASSSDERLALRLAVLFHDVGKLAGRKPRRHAHISSALFGQHVPPWFPATLVPLTQWLIETHDLFGVFGRGLTEKPGVAVADFAVDLDAPSSYPHALDAQAVRTALRASGLPLERAAALHKAVWKADVGSVAALRWLLPVADLIERLVHVRPHR